MKWKFSISFRVKKQWKADLYNTIGKLMLESDNCDSLWVPGGRVLNSDKASINRKLSGLK